MFEDKVEERQDMDRCRNPRGGAWASDGTRVGARVTPSLTITKTATLTLPRLVPTLRYNQLYGVRTLKSKASRAPPIA